MRGDTRCLGNYLLTHDVPTDVPSVPSTAHRSRGRATRAGCAAAAVAALLAAGACASGSSANGSPVVISTPSSTSGYHGVTLDRPYTKPDVTFTDTSGRPFNLKTETREPVTLVYFGYTNCPDVCPTTLADITAALRRAPASVRDKVQLVFVTTDPARDTRQVMREWLDTFDSSYVGLTASMATIKKAADQLGVPLTGKEKLPSGGYDVGHGSQVIAFDATGRARLLWLAGTSVGDYRDDIVRLVRGT